MKKTLDTPAEVKSNHREEAAKYHITTSVSADAPAPSEFTGGFLYYF